MHAAAPTWRVLIALAALALLLHAALLGGVAAGSDANKASAPTAAMQVRTLPAAEPATAPAMAAVVAPTPATSATPPARTARAPRLARPPVVERSAAVTPAEPVAAPVAEPVPAAAAESPPVVAAEPAASSAAPATPATPATTAVAADRPAARAPGDDEIPVYKTVIPPPLTLTYDLSRGLLGGTGTLSWRPDGGRYEARLEGRVAGLNVLTQVSQGGFDDAGLAPNRFTDQRMGREVRAANFQREQGRITFSGPQTEFTLLIGTQDRLSWMIQLAAVVSAEPQRLAPGGKVALYVVGARADASMWVFRYVGEESVDTPGGPVNAVKFSREARGPYDTQADAWLDLARHGLPVRARLGTGSDGDALDLVLRDMHAP